MPHLDVVLFGDVCMYHRIELLGEYVCDSCNMGTSDLNDMYAQSPRAEDIHIRQITSAHVTTNM